MLNSQVLLDTSISIMTIMLEIAIQDILEANLGECIVNDSLSFVIFLIIY